MTNKQKMNLTYETNIHIIFNMLIICRHQHKIHLLSKLVDSNFTIMQQLTTTWSHPHATHKIEGSKFILYLLVNKFNAHL